MYPYEIPPVSFLRIPYNTIQSTEVIFVLCFSLVNTLVCTDVLRDNAFVTFKNIYNWV